mmetsp:Transcript_67324/g.132805  ORF Transcript_67324/g.132805 Transcript_67324/m.132805 type:complete len:519 (-) Transcript_67324:19-1575(-)
MDHFDPNNTPLMTQPEDWDFCHGALAFPCHKQDLKWTSLQEDVEFELRETSSNRLGGGSMGVVFRGYCNGQVVAAKAHQALLNPEDYCLDEFHNLQGVLRECTHEMRILMSLGSHPNIIEFIGVSYYFYTDHNVNIPAWILTPVAEKGPLDRHIHRKPGLTLTQIEKFGRELGCGLLHLHAHNFVHRDIKPANLLVMSNGRLVIADLGLARVLEKFMRISRGTGCGTLAYCGPEGADSVLPARDIFAAGCVLVEAVLQEQPNIDKRKRNDQKQRSLEIAGDQGSELLAQTIKTALHEIPWCRPKASSFMIPMDPANAAVSFGEACSEPTDTEVVTYITSLVTKGKTPEGVHKLCKDAPAAIRNNERCMLATVRKNGCLLEYASTTMRKHKKIILAAVQQNGAALKFALPFEADRVFLEQLMPESGAGSLDDQDFYRAFFLKAVQRDGHYLMFASRSLRNDMDLVVAATKNNPKVLMYASAALQEELRQRPPVPEVIQDIPKRQPSWLGWLRRISRGGG